MNEEIIDLYTRVCTSPGIDADDTITVGVVDSLYDPDNCQRLVDAPVNRTVTEFDEPNDEVRSHGAGVINILTGMADNIEINLYQVVQDVSNEGEYLPRAHTRDVCNAIFKAIDYHDVDVLNLSLGSDHSQGREGCHAHRQPCKLRQSVRDAAAAGIHVCAAVGNSKQAEGPICPATSREAITVGAVDPTCTASLSQTDPITKGPEVRPPMAAWFDSPFDEQPDEGVFCTGNDCAPGDEYSCDRCRKWVVWEGNVDGHAGVTDLYAPHRIINRGKEDCPSYKIGTSWAVPIVTAVVSDRVAATRSAGEEISTSEMRAMITESAEAVGEGGEKLLRASNLDSAICQKKKE